jgi:hypothetical protein
MCVKAVVRVVYAPYQDERVAGGEIALRSGVELDHEEPDRQGEQACQEEAMARHE